MDAFQRFVDNANRDDDDRKRCDWCFLHVPSSSETLILPVRADTRCCIHFLMSSTIGYTVPVSNSPFALAAHSSADRIRVCTTS